MKKRKFGTAIYCWEKEGNWYINDAWRGVRYVHHWEEAIKEIGEALTRCILRNGLGDKGILIEPRWLDDVDVKE